MNKNKSNEEKWREEWFKWIVSTNQIVASVNKEYLFSVWADSLKSFVSGRKAGEEEIEDLLIDKKFLLDDKYLLEQEISQLKAENERLKDLLDVSLDYAEWAKGNECVSLIEMVGIDDFIKEVRGLK